MENPLNQDFDYIVNRVAALIASRVQSRIAASAELSRITPRLLTVKEAAGYIGRTEQAVQHLIHKRDLIVVRRGRRVHVDRADLDRWIDANKM